MNCMNVYISIMSILWKSNMSCKCECDVNWMKVSVTVISISWNMNDYDGYCEEVKMNISMVRMLVRMMIVCVNVTQHCILP